MLKRKISSAAFFCAFLFAAIPAMGADLFEAIRNNDLAALRTGAEKHDAREARGPGGATPLIYAAAFGSPESVRMLADAGAELDARTDLDATALIWAAGDPEKTEILVRAGANVNLASKNGRTPLLVAAARDGSLETVKMLIEAGADERASDGMGATPLLAASLAGDAETVKFLLDRGADPNQADKAGTTPLQNAAGNLDREMIRALLAKGANVNAANTFGGRVRHGDIELKGLTPLMLAAPHGSPAVLGMLIEAGAEVDARDSRGMTALMLAAASSRQNHKSMKLLLAHGADPNAVSVKGETPLDWAAKYNDPDVLMLLERAGAKAKAKPAVVDAPMARGRDAREAAVLAIRAVQASEAEFFRQSACVACHHQGMTQIATAATRNHNVRFDERAAKESVEATAALWSGFAPMLLERLDPPGSPDTPTFSLFGLAMQQRESDFTSGALFANIAAQQRADGSWRLMGFSRAPMEESHFARTAMAVRALEAFAPVGRRAEMAARRQRAKAWLLAQTPRSTDDFIWRLAGLKWAGATESQIADAAHALKARQNEDGGWAPSKTMLSDAFTTGSALWALHETGTAAADSDQYERGVGYLLATQREDGTWYVASRGAKFQPYFESGFPYGHDQWISVAATAWAAAALAPAAHTPTTTD